MEDLEAKSRARDYENFILPTATELEAEGILITFKPTLCV